MKGKKGKEENKIYLIKEGKQVVSGWEFMQLTGMLDSMKQIGFTINPTHSFELLKQTRQELFGKVKQNFSEERKMNKLETSDFEISYLYYSWLKGELNTIENWLSDTFPNGKKRPKASTSDQIEILKYKQFVNNEMIQAEKEISQPKSIKLYESRTKNVIIETITNIDIQGWQYAFVSEQDFNLFTDLLTNFFELKPYTVPETIIQLKRTCKTKVAKALGEIHKELSKVNKLTADTKYFQLIRVLSHFEKEPEGDLYKALTR